MRIIWGYFKERAWFALLLVLCVGLFAQVLRLYDLPAEAVGYASLLCAAAFAVWTAGVPSPLGRSGKTRVRSPPVREGCLASAPLPQEPPGTTARL